MSDNKPNNMEQMQRDAENRLREMQKRANRAVHGSDMPPVPNFVRMNNRYQQKSNHATPEPQVEHRSNRSMPETRAPEDNSTRSKGGILGRFKGLDILKMFNFQNIHIDNDVLIIIALIFLLSTDETDELLLLALVYIML